MNTDVHKTPTFIIEPTFTLPLLASIEKINTYFLSINQEEEIDVGLFRVPIPHYAPQAFRKALINAYSHRDYSMLGRVRVLVERDGMTIANPGGFIQGITYDSLLDAEPHGRNPVLADCLKRIGMAERSGRGIDRIYVGSLRYGKLRQTTANLLRRLCVFIFQIVALIKILSDCL